MRDPIVETAITQNLRHLPYRDGVGNGERPVTVEVVKFAKDRARQAELTQPLPPAPRVTVKEPRKAPRVPRAGVTVTAAAASWVRRDLMRALGLAVMLLVVCSLHLVVATALMAASLWLMHREWRGLSREAHDIGYWFVDVGYRIGDAIHTPRMPLVLTPPPTFEERERRVIESEEMRCEWEPREVHRLTRPLMRRQQPLYAQATPLFDGVEMWTLAALAVTALAFLSFYLHQHLGF